MDCEEVNPCDHLRKKSASAVEALKQRDTGGTRAQADRYPNEREQPAAGSSGRNHGKQE